MGKRKAIFFDLTDTLQEFDWDKQWRMYARILASEGIDANMALFREKHQQVYEVYRLGELKNDYHFIDVLFRTMGWSASPAKKKRILKRFLRARKSYTWLPEGLEQTLRELKRDFRLAIVSNGVKTFADHDFAHYLHFEPKKYFAAQLYSQNTGHLKESDELFRLALKRLKVKPQDVTYVGNSYQDDILRARDRGFRTVFLAKRGEPKGKADFRITHLSQLQEIAPNLG